MHTRYIEGLFTGILELLIIGIGNSTISFCLLADSDNRLTLTMHVWDPPTLRNHRQCGWSDHATYSGLLTKYQTMVALQCRLRKTLQMP